MSTNALPETVAVRFEPASAAQDVATVEAIAALVNAVYDVAESGLWADGAQRTSPAEVAELIADGQIATARAGGRLVGAVRFRSLDSEVAEFGMLAADPEWRGRGVGRDLVAFAEASAAASGHRTMQLEVLVPRTWTHPSKEFLRAWYARLGYRVERVTHLEELYPDLAPLLATECDLEVSRKPLVGASTRENTTRSSPSVQ
ncbi:GNAT family N-acetyltransferase [Agromyces aurantiacus]|uniref:GNAT family N-acetyltransferase n=1 Tax=Agromyces aurantiacus TaxID=165814 RepID=A0ABV9R838_9MICO|nr:GNAT family N-acetyltransferase [Agromyces aurantiacus]MBM7505149.1 GNAT superfamily N-acetyltransferase [Agromyces aurantiacus]